MSPERKAKELFNSDELRPLYNYLIRWKKGEVQDSADYVLEVIACYLRLMAGQVQP